MPLTATWKMQFSEKPGSRSITVFCRSGPMPLLSINLDRYHATSSRFRISWVDIESRSPVVFVSLAHSWWMVFYPMMERIFQALSLACQYLDDEDSHYWSSGLIDLISRLLFPAPECFDFFFANAITAGRIVCHKYESTCSLRSHCVEKMCCHFATHQINWSGETAKWYWLWLLDRATTPTVGTRHWIPIHSLALWNVDVWGAGFSWLAHGIP